MIILVLSIDWKEIRSEAKVFFKNFGKNKLGEVTGAKIKRNLKDLMKLPGYTLTYGIGGESGLMKSEVLKRKSKNSIQNLWEKTLEYVEIYRFKKNNRKQC